jgi:hypothetical protein
MPVIRAADIMSILAANHEREKLVSMNADQQRAAAVWTEIAIKKIRDQADQVICYTDDLEQPEGRTDLWRLPVLFRSTPAHTLNAVFHETMVC